MRNRPTCPGQEMDPPTKRPAIQFSLRELVAIVAGCAAIFAAFNYRDFLAFAVVSGVLAGWSSRVALIPLRWTLVGCLGGCSVFCVGLLCVDLALERSNLARDPVAESLAFLAPFFAVFGLAFAAMGILMAIVRYATGKPKRRE
ncbi:MAG TPA: hypothetical protein QF564_01280 [Pirellulaceae bacterium]|nr:hypothetical protein [Pirellulaceae bacterium]